MKRLSEMSREDLLNLSTEDEKDLIDLECAYNEIPLLPPVPQKQEALMPKTNCTVYEVAGVKLIDKTEAAKLQEFIANLTSRVTTDYDYRTAYDIYYAELIVDNIPVITTHQVYAKETFELIKQEIKRVKDTKDNYDKDMSKYLEIKDKRALITTEVARAIEEATDHARRLSHLKYTYERYLKLADSDHRIAMKFLKGAEDLEGFEDALTQWIETLE